VDEIPVEPFPRGSFQRSTFVHSTFREYLVDANVIADLDRVQASNLNRLTGWRNQIAHTTKKAEVAFWSVKALEEWAASDTEQVRELVTLPGSVGPPQPDLSMLNFFLQATYVAPYPGEPDALAALVSTQPESVSDDDVSAHWRALPAYGDRPFEIRVGACCLERLPSIPPEVIDAARASHHDAAVPLSALVAWAGHVGRAERIRVTTANSQIAADYCKGLRQFIGGILVVLRQMLVLVMAALSHQPQTPTFLLVMLSSIRHYGHRGEPDGHFLPAPAVQPCRSRGVVCLVT
jgi:hypothetical protein